MLCPCHDMICSDLLRASLHKRVQYKKRTSVRGGDGGAQGRGGEGEEGEEGLGVHFGLVWGFF